LAAEGKNPFRRRPAKMKSIAKRYFFSYNEHELILRAFMKIILTFLFLLIAVMVLPVRAEVLSISDAEMDGIDAMGTISIGSYQWNDNHQFDASTNKGAIIMDGNAEQYVNAENLVNATQSAISTGVNISGDLNSNGGPISLTNNNEATAFVGGF
jgi:hypothetical protein